MPLFQIQDSDTPMWVVADNWNDALIAWRQHIEHYDRPSGKLYDSANDEDPDGINLVADAREVIVVEDGKWRVL